MRRWLSDSALTVADQYLVSGANFAVQLALVNWLGVGEYGVFAILFAVFLFAAGFQNALVLEPSSVLGPSRHDAHLRGYLRRQFELQMGLSLALGLLGIMVTYAIGLLTSWDTSAAYALCLALPFLLSSWAARRFCYVLRRPAVALAGSFGYSLVVVAGLLLVERFGGLSASLAIGIMAFASGIAAVGMVAVSGILRACKPTESWGELFTENWAYGRWVSASAVVAWLNTSAIIPVLGAVLGPSSAGLFKAVQNLFLPAQQACAALGMLFLPAAARRLKHPTRRELDGLYWRLLGVLGGSAVAFAILASLSSKQLLTLLYPNTSIAADHWLVVAYAIPFLLMMCREAAAVLAKAIQKPQWVFIAQACAALLFAGSIALTYLFGIAGAVSGIAGAALIEFSVLTWLLRRALPDSDSQSSRRCSVGSR